MTKIGYAGYRFPPVIIQQAIWLYLRFTLSFGDMEDLLAERGIIVICETVRRWVNHFGPKIAADLRKRRPNPILLGIWTRSISRSTVGWSIYGGGWTPRARRQTFWSRVGETSMQRWN
jgi:hypothetical protein